MGGEDQGGALGKTRGDPLLELFKLPGGRGHGAVEIILRAVGEIDRLQKPDVAPVENDRGSKGKTGRGGLAFHKTQIRLHGPFRRSFAPPEIHEQPHVFEDARQLRGNGPQGPYIGGVEIIRGRMLDDQDPDLDLPLLDGDGEEGAEGILMGLRKILEARVARRIALDDRAPAPPAWRPPSPVP